MKVYFQEVKYHEKKSGKCSVCGKTCTISKKFYQTLNPFNKNADGTIKTHGDIYKELMIQIKEWEKIPPIHGKCEDVSNGQSDKVY